MGGDYAESRAWARRAYLPGRHANLNTMDEAFEKNTVRRRFELTVGEAVVYATFREAADTLYIDYVEAPPELRGTGAAGRLMEHIAATARHEGRKIVPICGYAASWLQRHREHADLLA